MNKRTNERTRSRFGNSACVCCRQCDRFRNEALSIDLYLSVPIFTYSTLRLLFDSCLMCSTTSSNTFRCIKSGLSKFRRRIWEQCAHDIHVHSVPRISCETCTGNCLSEGRPPSCAPTSRIFLLLCNWVIRRLTCKEIHRETNLMEFH